MSRQSNAYKRLVALYDLVVRHMRDGARVFGAMAVAPWARVEWLEPRVLMSAAQGNEFALNQTLNDNQQLPAIASDASGNFIAVWQTQNQDGSGWGIYGRQYNSAGVALGNEFLINQTTQGDQTKPAVACDPAGAFVVTWVSSNDVYARLFNANGTAQTNEFIAIAEPPNGSCTPSVAMDGNGNFDVVSDEAPNASAAIFLQRFNADASANGATITVNTTSTKQQKNPSVAMNAAGDAVICWTDSSAGPSKIRARQFGPDGSTAGRDFLVGTSGNDAEDFAKAGLDSAGNFTITWQDNFGGPNSIDVVARRYNASDAALDATPITVNTYTNDNQQSPAISELPAGQYFIAWQSNNQDGNNWGVYGQMFNADGSRNGTVIQVNTTTQGPQKDPALTWGGTTATIVWDGQGAVSNQAIYGQQFVTPSVANQAPVLTSPYSETISQGSTLTFSSAAGTQITDADTDGGTATEQIQLAATEGTLTLATTSGLTFIAGTGTNDTTVTIDGTLADLNAALNGLVYTPAASFSGSDTLQIVADDLGNTGTGGAKTVTTGVSITVTPVAHTPSATNATTAILTQSTSGLVITPNALDQFNGYFQIAGITGGTLYQHDGSTAISNNQFITFAQGEAGLAFSPTLGLLSGSFNIQASTTNSTAGLGGSVISASITVGGSPVNSVPGAQTTPQATPLIFSTANGNAISLSDTGTPTVTLSVDNGTLGLSTTAGLTFNSGSNNSGAMQFTGSIANINAALDSLSFVPPATFTGAATITLVNESGSTTTSTIGVSVTPTAQTPTVTNATTRENIQTSNGLVITQNAQDTSSDYFQISGIRGGTLYLNDGVTQISDGQFITSAQGAAGLRFAPAPDSTAPGGFNVQASATGDSTGLGGSIVPASISVYGPLAMTLDSGSVAYTEGQGVAAVDSTLAVSDPGGAMLTGATVTLIGNVPGEDVLSFTAQNGITGSWNAGTGVMTLSGSTTAANYQAALQSVTYTDTSQNPSTAARGAEFTLDDAISSSDPVSRLIQVTAVNTAPTINAPATVTTYENTSDTFAGTVSVADVDADGGLEVVALTATNGTITLGSTSGLSAVSGNSTASVSLTGTIAALNTALSGMQFVPTTSYTGPATLGITIDDQGNSGTGGAMIASEDVSITVSTGPTPDMYPAAQTTTENVPLTFSPQYGNTISAGSAATSVGLSVSGGTLTLSATSGLTFINGTSDGAATLEFEGTEAAMNAALNGLVFTPSANFTGSDPLTFITAVQSGMSTVFSTYTIPLTVSPAPPTIATAAAANPNPVTGTTAALSVLGADAAGESTLTYNWTTTGSPPAPVTFSINGSNASKNTTATFSAAGTYDFTVTISDAGGLTVTSSVAVSVSQVLSEIIVLPSLVSVPVGTTQQCSAVAYDQFGNPLASQPGFTWSVNGGGSINQSGLYTAPGAVGVDSLISATSGSHIGLAEFVTVAGPANVVPPGADSGTTGQLSITGYNGSYVFTWSVVSQPPGAPTPTFSVNGSSAASQTVCTFYQAGVYVIICNFGNANGSGTRYCAALEVTVEQTTTAISVTPTSAALNENGTQQFVATATDQFANVMSPEPAFTWSVTPGAGSISSGGFFTAGGSVGSWAVQASSGSINGTASVTVTNAVPTVAIPAAAASSPVTGISTGLSVLGADDGGESNLTYTWVTTGAPPAPVTFSANASNAAKNTIATFTAPGLYSFLVTITDSGGLTTTSTVDVAVDSTLTRIAVSAGPGAMADNTTYPFSATGLDQFGNALASQPTFTWSVDAGGAGGSINLSGVYSTPASATGTDIIRATSDAVSGTASVTVTSDGIFGGGYDVGTPTYPGSFSYNSGTYTLTGSYGAGPTGGFQFANTTFTGNTALVARVASVNGTATPAQAGLMFRDTSDGSAAFVEVVLQSGNQVAFCDRTTSGGSIEIATIDSVVAPQWIALVRSGDTFSGYFSADGTTWTPVGSTITYADPSAILGGLVASSLDETTLSTATFTNVGVAAPTIAMPAIANPNPVTGASVALSVLGAYPGGESDLTYTWTTTGMPPAAVSFTDNADNAAKNTTATFTAAGTYDFLVTVSDGVLSASSTVSVTVNPAHTPTVSNASTRTNEQTTSGLVISPNALDGSLSGYYQISSITGGTLYQSDGVTSIAEGSFITFAQGNAGLKFTPTIDSTSDGSFSVQAAITATTDGLGGSIATATIAVAGPPVVAPSGSALAYTEGDGAVAVDPAVALSDPGSSTLVSATLDLEGYVLDEDALACSGQNGITQTWNSTTGVLTLTGSASLADYQTALRSVTYSDSSSNPNTASRTVMFTVSDGAETSAPVSRPITVTAVNNAPTTSQPGAQSIDEDTSLTFSSSNLNAIVVADVDANNGVEQVTLAATHGTLAIDNTGNLASLSGNDSASVTFTATIQQLNDALNGLHFTPDSHYFGDAQFDITIDDQGNTGIGGSMAASASVDVSINRLAHTPAVSDVTINENSADSLTIAPSPLDAGLQGYYLVTAITNGSLYQADGVTPVENGDFISFAQGAAGVTFVPTPDSTASGSFSVQASVSPDASGLGGSPTTASITMLPVPQVQVPLPQTTPEDTSITFSATNGNALSVTDPGAPSGRVQITLASLGGLISLTNRTGLTFQSGSGVSDDTTVFTGTFADVNRALDGITFVPSLHGYGAATIDLTATEGPNSATAEADINIQRLAHTPSVSSASTNVNQQTTGGLILSPNDLDRSVDGYFQITDITGGTLYLHDGATPINDGDFVPFSQGSIGLRFTPASDSLSEGHFMAQASTSADISGLGGAAVVATIYVTKSAQTQTLAALGGLPGAPTGSSDGSGSWSSQSVGSVAGTGQSQSDSSSSSGAPQASDDAAGQKGQRGTGGGLTPPAPPAHADAGLSKTASASSKSGAELLSSSAIAPSHADTATAATRSESDLTVRYAMRAAKLVVTRRLSTGLRTLGTIDTATGLSFLANRGGAMWHEMDALHKKLVSDAPLRVWAGSATGAAVGISVGYFLWMVRAGSLLSSLLSSMPAWQLVDPLPILDHLSTTAAALRRGEDDGLDRIIRDAAGQ